MDEAMQQSILSKPNVTGLLCIDQQGLVISGKGDINPNASGRYTSIMREVKKMNNLSKNCKVIIETEQNTILVKTYDYVHVVVKSSNI